jgi:hypothetical protein
MIKYMRAVANCWAPQSKLDTGLFYSVWDTFRDHEIDTCARPVPKLFHDDVKEQLDEADRILNDVIMEQTEVIRPLTDATSRVGVVYNSITTVMRRGFA